MPIVKYCSALGLSIIGVALWAAAPAPARAVVLAPGDPIAGIDQATLSQNWWNWAASYAPAANPLTDFTGSRASLGNKGSYFFLAGASSTDPIVRSVTVRNHQTLFFPIINTVNGYNDQQIADKGLTESDIRTETTHYLGNASGLFLKLDGGDMAMPAGAASLLAFRQPTGKFDLILPTDDNIFGGPPLAPAGTYRSFTDGYWVGLSPFHTGTYRLHFGGTVAQTGPFAGQTFTQDITYQLTVVPEPATFMLMLAGLGAVAGLAARRRDAT